MQLSELETHVCRGATFRDRTSDQQKHALKLCCMSRDPPKAKPAVQLELGVSVSDQAPHVLDRMFQNIPDQSTDPQSMHTANKPGVNCVTVIKRSQSRPTANKPGVFTSRVIKRSQSGPTGQTANTHCFFLGVPGLQLLTCSTSSKYGLWLEGWNTTVSTWLSPCARVPPCGLTGWGESHGGEEAV